jgi:glycosyltransferase involved in cell wall biosynthesis
VPGEHLVSVIIPTYGRHEFLVEAAESVAAQTHSTIELIVVDDCSDEAVPPPSADRIDVRIVRHVRNLGPGAARNTGIAHARGEFVLFLDDDDLLAPDRVRDGVLGIAEARMHAARTTISTRRYEGDMRATLLHGHVPYTGQVLFRREDLVQFDPTLRVGEDTEWWIRMRDRAIFAWSDNVGVTIRGHDGPRLGVSDDVRAACRAAIMTRHWDELDPAARAYFANRAGSGALLAGRRVEAARFAARSLSAKFNPLALKILFRSLTPYRKHWIT